MLADEIISMSFTTARISLEVLYGVNKLIIQKYLDHDYKQKHSGEQSLKYFNESHDVKEPITIHEKDIELFRQNLKRLDVDFSVVKTNANDYTVFYKAKDAGVIIHALQEMTQEKLIPTLDEKMKQAAEKAKDINASLTVEKVKNKVVDKAL